jgi:hypothetical protein
LIDDQLADRQWVIGSGLDGLSIEDHWIGCIVSVVRKDEAPTHRHWMVQIDGQPERGRRGLGTLWGCHMGPIPEKSVGATGFEPAT